jgi:hypothetical protein
MKIRDMDDNQLLTIWKSYKSMNAKSVNDMIYEERLANEVLRRERKYNRCLGFNSWMRN